MLIVLGMWENHPFSMEIDAPIEFSFLQKSNGTKMGVRYKML